MVFLTEHWEMESYLLWKQGRRYSLDIRGKTRSSGLVITRHTGKVLRTLSNKSFDGDTSSGNCAYSDEAKEDAKRFFSLRKAYIGTNGKLLYSTSVDTVDLVLHSLTGEPVSAAVENYSLMGSFRDSLENHEEVSSCITHLGTRYDLSDLEDMTEAIEPTTIGMVHLLDDVAATNAINPDLVKQADSNVPLIGIRDKDKIHILNCKHRLYKLHHEQAPSAQVKFITQDILDIARRDD